MSEESSRCTWKEDEEGVWNTACGEAFDLTCDTPKEHGMNFCCFCGKKLTVGMGKTRYDR